MYSELTWFSRWTRWTIGTLWSCKILNVKVKTIVRNVWRYQRGISSLKSNTNRQYDGQQKNDIRINNDMPSITQITKDRATRTPLKTRCEFWCSVGVRSSCSTCDTRRVARPLFYIKHSKSNNTSARIYYCKIKLLLVPRHVECFIVYLESFLLK